MKEYTFTQIRRATFNDDTDRTDCATPADVYVCRHVNRCVRKGDKKKAIAYLIERKLLKSTDGE